jgi:hypothetical protein
MRTFTLSVGDITWELERRGDGKRLVVYDDEGNEIFETRLLPPEDDGSDESKVEKMNFMKALLNVYRKGFSDGSFAGERNKQSEILAALGVSPNVRTL